MLVNLVYLSCSSNQLQGTIRPALMSALTQLSILWLESNALTGSIPAMGAMTDLRPGLSATICLLDRCPRIGSALHVSGS